jgi:hypothetical protein
MPLLHIVSRLAIVAVVVTTVLAAGPVLASGAAGATVPVDGPPLQVDGDDDAEVFDTPVGTTLVDGTLGTSLRLFITNARPDSRAVIERIEITGPDADQFATAGVDLPLTLTGATVHHYVVEFRPTSPGEKRAELTVYDRSGLVAVHHLSGTAVTPDATEPNDDFEAAAPLTAGEPVGSVLVADDTDVYAVEAAAGQTLTVRVDNTGDADLDYFLARDGQFRVLDIERVSAGDSSTRTITASRAGTYQVLVANHFAMRGTEAGFRYEIVTPYELTVTVDGAAVPTGTDADVDPDGDGDGPGEGTFGSNSTRSGTSDRGAVEGGDGGGDPDSPVESEAATPGFGGLAVLVAVAIAVAVLVTRRR